MKVKHQNRTLISMTANSINKEDAQENITDIHLDEN